MRLVNLSNLDWVDSRLKRNQAIFLELLDSGDTFSKGIYINPPRLAGSGWQKYLRPWSYRVVEKRTPGGKLVAVVESTYTLWDWHAPMVRSRRAAHMKAWLQEQLIEEGPYLLWLNTAGRLQVPLAEQCSGDAWRTVFDWSDDFRAPGFGMRIQDLERLTALSDRVLCVNQVTAAAAAHPRCRIFHNCTNPAAFEHWDIAFRLDPLWPKPEGAIYIGFTGGIHWTRADRPLLEAVLRRFPQYRFVFVGYTDGPRIGEWLGQFSNATFVGEVPYTDLTHIIHSFDVAIIPHEDNEYTRGNDLLKVLEYFGCGVPVVTTPCSGIERYRDALWIAKDPREFGDRIEALVAGDLRPDVERGRAIARAQAWARQVPELAKWVMAS